MFGFFVNGNFEGVWGNRPNDEFFDNTCVSLDWEKSQTTLVYYLKHREKPEHNYQYFIDKVIERDLEGNITKEINSEIYVLNGVKQKFC